MRESSTLPIVTGIIITVALLLMITSLVITFLTVFEMYGWITGLLVTVIFNILLILLAIYGTRRINR